MKFMRKAALIAGTVALVTGAGATSASAGQLTPTATFSGGGCTASVYLNAPNWGSINAGAGGACARTVPGYPKLTLAISRNGVQIFNQTATMGWNGSQYGTLLASAGYWWWGPKGTRWQACAISSNSNGVWLAGGCSPVWVAP